MDLTILDILYTVLIIFTVLVWTLFSIVLFKLIKVLNVIMEIVSVYDKFKTIFWIYSKIPNLLLEKIKNIFTKK